LASRETYKVERVAAAERDLDTLFDFLVASFIVDEEARVVRVLAVFFGGQDHQRAMLRRLLGG